MLYIILVLSVILILILLANWLLVNASLHPVRTPLFLSPHDVNIPHEDVEFRSKDGTRLSGWWLPAPNPVGIAVLCHGYLMNRSEPLTVARHLWAAGFHCLVFDFRASGKSGGAVCTIGHQEAKDVIAAVDFALSCAPGLPVVAYGASMGGAAVILAAAEDERIRAVVADSAYSRLSEAVDDWWRNLLGKLAWLVKPSKWMGHAITRVSSYHVAPERAIPQIAPRPIMLIHGTRDAIIRPYHAERLHAAASEPKQIWWAQGSDHVQARFDHPGDFYPRVTEFCLQAVRKQPPDELPATPPASGSSPNAPAAL